MSLLSKIKKYEFENHSISVSDIKTETLIMHLMGKGLFLNNKTEELNSEICEQRHHREHWIQERTQQSIPKLKKEIHEATTLIDLITSELSKRTNK